MPAPVSADRYLAALKAEGVKVVETPGWKTHNRNGHGTWGPVNGVMIHHTVTGPKVNAVQMCYDGLSDLPGPLCHTVIRRDGTAHLTGYGRANHAGGGDPRVLEQVISEQYGDWPVETRQHQGSSGSVDGNAHFLGAECENLGDGKDPWTAAQLDTMVRWSAAICRLYGWSAKSVIGHKEWSDWKNDPHGPGMPSMPEFRRRVQERLTHPASWTKPSAPAPTQPKPTTPTAPGTVEVMTMDRLSLGRNEDLTVPPGGEVQLYWTSEYADSSSAHGAGNKTVLTGLTYTGHLYLNTSGPVYVVGVEEDSNGVELGRGDAVRVQSGGDSAGFTGYTGQRLTFRVTNPSTTPVTVYLSRLNLWVSPSA